MAQPRMIQGQFGATIYDSGIIAPNSNLPAPTVQYNETGAYLGVKRHNDQFFIPDPTGQPNQPLTPDGLHFATFDYVDLRDLLEEKSCLDDITINVQRLKELPYPNFTFNLAPGNIEETFMVILGDLKLGDQSTFITTVSKMHKAGFEDFTQPGQEGGLPFEVLYRENRQYVQDPSQNFVSPDQMGSQAGATGDPAQANTRWVGNFRLSSRTIGGYPDLVVGPGLTIIRVWSMWPTNRLSQTLVGDPAVDSPADEFTFLQSRLQVYAPALQYNIVGTQRKLTATETATYYSNILLTQ